MEPYSEESGFKIKMNDFENVAQSFYSQCI